MAGGRRRPLRSSPGNTSDGDAKNAAKPREKKFGVLPGELKMSRGIWKSRSPIWMKMSDSKSWEVNRGTGSLVAKQYLVCAAKHLQL